MSSYCQYGSCNQKFGLFNHRYECTICKKEFCDDHVCNASYTTQFIDGNGIFDRVQKENGYLCPDCFASSGLNLSEYERSIFQRKCNHAGCEKLLSSVLVTKVSCRHCGNWFCEDHAVACAGDDGQFPQAEGICHECYEILEPDGDIEQVEKDNNNAEFYKALRTRIKKWADSKGTDSKYLEYLLLAPDLFHLLCKLTTDSTIDMAEKASVIAATAYFVMPMDLIPEGIVGPAGYIDDVAVAAWILGTIISNSKIDAIKKHWAGDGEVIEVIQKISSSTEEMVGSGMWSKVKKFLTKDNTKNESGNK